MSKSIVLACTLAFVASAALAAKKPPASPPSRTAPAAAPATPAKAPAPVVAPAPNLPAMTAAEIVDRNVAARGGLTAWRAVNTLMLEGKVDAGGKPNVELPFVMRMKRGHKSRLELAFRDQTAVQVYDGTGLEGAAVPESRRGRAVHHERSEGRGRLGRIRRTADRLREEREPRSSWRERNHRGPRHYKLKLTLKSGDERHLWIDATTFLESKIDGEPRKMDGRLRAVPVFYRDYKTVNGLTMPHALETVGEGVKSSHKMTSRRWS